jgi:hypothetical protein
MTNLDDIRKALKKETALNQAADAFFHVCALRQRNRNKLTIKSIYQKMLLKGFNYDRSHYEKILKVMADLDLGKLEVNKKGKTIGLTDIKIPLKKLGALVIEQKLLVSEATIVKTSEATKQQWGAGATARGPKGYPVSITVVVNGKPVNFRVPPELTTTDIADLVVRFRSEGIEKDN